MVWDCEAGLNQRAALPCLLLRWQLSWRPLQPLNLCCASTGSAAQRGRMVLLLLELLGVSFEGVLCSNSAAYLQHQLAAESLQQLPGGFLLVTPWTRGTGALLGAPCV